MPNRFIADHGLTLQLAIEHVRHLPPNHPNQHCAGLQLDQEKAYDRVSQDYLSAILAAFGFPDCLVSSLIQLFFNTKICINVNGLSTANIEE